MTDIFKAYDIAKKWEKCRDTVYRFYTLLDKDSGEEKYKERMKLLQAYIKACMVAERLDTIPAITHLGNMVNDGMLAAQIIAAGYDLMNGLVY